MKKTIMEYWRPDPKRMIILHGPFALDVARRLAAKITLLQKISREPIALQIQCSGGQVRAFYELNRALQSTGERGGNGPVITVGKGASSAAAYLLVAGQFAVAQKGSSLGFHGVRVSRFHKGRSFRYEQVLSISLRVDGANRKIAAILARRVVFRLLARYAQLNQRSMRPATPREPGRQIQDFVDKISRRLSSPAARNVLRDALRRYRRLFSFARHAATDSAWHRRTGFVQQEAKIFKGLVDYHAESIRTQNRSINPATAAELMMDYLLTREFLRGRRLPLLKKLANDNAHGKRNPAKGRAYLVAIGSSNAFGWWCFALTLCHRLLQAQNNFSSSDAYWLGLVDKVLE